MMPRGRRSTFAGGRPVVDAPASVPPVTRIRTTLLTASLLAIKDRGLLDEYRRELPAEHREYIESLVGMDWAPFDVGMAHYGALDRLQLSNSDQYDIGLQVGTKLNQSLLGTAMRLAGEAGATPWTALTQLPRLWTRMLDGGAIGIYELGPKDARIELHGCPLARYAYCRNGWRGIITGALMPLCRRVFITELSEMCDDDRFTMHAAWA